MSSKTASMLCYIPLVGWLASIVVLASPKFRSDRNVRFHAFQGIYLFVIWLIIDLVIQPFAHIVPGPTPMHGIAKLLHIVVFGAWIFMMIKTSQEQMFHLPLVGDLAERSLAEQR